jgi:hypothetical protein
MKPLLLHRDRDFDLQQRLVWNERALVQDLVLETLLQAMALGEDIVREATLRVLLTSSRNDPETISNDASSSTVASGTLRTAARAPEKACRSPAAFLEKREPSFKAR